VPCQIPARWLTTSSPSSSSSESQLVLSSRDDARPRATARRDLRTIDAGAGGRFSSWHIGMRPLEASDHCERYEVSRCSENPTQYIVRIEWDSEDGHLSGFRESPEFGRFFEAVGPFAHDIEEMRHYRWRSRVACIRDERPGKRPGGRPVVDRFYAAWNRHDAPELVELFGSNGIYADRITRVALSGANLADHFGRTLSVIGDLRLLVDRTINDHGAAPSAGGSKAPGTERSAISPPREWRYSWRGSTCSNWAICPRCACSAIR
jgi:quinol monooxygenase YgiN